LDEAERCTRVGLMNKGRLMKVDTPSSIKRLMKGEIVEIVCERVRDAYRLLSSFSPVKEVQAFGDRLNVNVRNPDMDLPRIRSALESNGIAIKNWRVVPPSLENVFISLLTQDEQQEVVT
ncbi:MAG: DUF4162 domain-containing protein, partial [Ignavibacteria bacterium]|nr:DUF4162 domain-containing protein [Ignavibacteria bacterium]